MEPENVALASVFHKALPNRPERNPDTLKNKLLDWVITLLQILPPTPAPLLLDVDPMIQIEVFIVCTEKLVFTPKIMDPSDAWMAVMEPPN